MLNFRGINPALRHEDEEKRGLWPCALVVMLTGRSEEDEKRCLISFSSFLAGASRYVFGGE